MIASFSRLVSPRVAITCAVAWLACNIIIATVAWAQPDPDILEAASHLDRASKLLHDAQDEASYRRTLSQRIKDLFDEGADAVQKLRDELDAFDWANNPFKMILGATQDVLGTMFPFLALGAGMRERHWRVNAGSPGK